MLPHFLHPTTEGPGEECTDDVCVMPKRAKALQDTAGERFKVVVVGLGPAGLSAVRGLVDACDIVVVEPAPQQPIRREREDEGRKESHSVTGISQPKRLRT